MNKKYKLKCKYSIVLTIIYILVISWTYITNINYCGDLTCDYAMTYLPSWFLLGTLIASQLTVYIIIIKLIMPEIGQLLHKGE